MTLLAYQQLRRRFQKAQHQHETTQRELQTLRALVEQQRSLVAQQMGVLLQTTNTGLLVENQQGTVMLNERLCQLLGLPQAPDAYVGQPSLHVLQQAQLPFANLAWTKAQMAAAVAGQVPVKGLLQELASGAILQVSYLPVVQQGHTVLHLWSYEDITQQHRTQQRLHELSLLAEQSPNPIICFSPTGQARYANPAAQTILQELKHPAEATANTLLQAEIQAALTQGALRGYEHSLGAARYLWTIAPLPQEEGVNVYLTDITARHQAQQQLEHSQLFARRLTDTIPHLVLLLDLDESRLVYCNSQSYTLLGYTEVEMIALGSRVLPTFLRPADVRALLERGPELARTGEEQILNSEYQMRHRDGSWRWMQVKSTPFLRHPDGRVRQMVASVEDVTARRHTEAQLRQSQRFVERLASTVPNLIYIFDIQQGRNVYCNQYIEQILGFSVADVQSMGSSLLTQLTDADQLLLLLEHFTLVGHCADGETRSVELYFTHRDGKRRWLRLTNSPFERNAAGAVTLVVGAGEDITHWKVAEEQRRAATRTLAEQNHLFRQVIDTTPHLVYLKDGAGNYLLANQATADLYELSVEEVIHTNTAYLPIAPQDASRYLLADGQVISTRQELVREETFTRPNGEVVWFYSIKRPFLLADGTVRVLGVDSNITALKQTQQALRLAKEAAEENARVKQDFLANMSHEIRTPMNGILGLAELLHKTPLDERQSQYLGHIRHAAEQLLVIINDILAMSQLGAGKIRLETTAFDLREVLVAIRQLLLPKAAEKGIALELELPPPEQSTLVIGDPHRLRQILLNLLSNAVKFTDQGQVLLSCRRLESSDDTLWFEFTVLDTGIGIPAHQLEQVFESFTQATASTAREYGGSGLGLSISRSLVELLGGTISVESRLHEGSTFRCSLPFARGQAPTTPESTPLKVPVTRRTLGPHRILLVEDNAINQLVVETQLRSWGCRVDIAPNGRDAVALFQRQSYAAVLMDIQLPGLDGVATAQLLRQHPDAPRAATPIIALTAHAMPGEAERYRTAGFDGYLSKPFREEELFGLLLQVLPPLPAYPTPAAPAPAAAEAAVLYNLSAIRRMAHGNETFVARLVQVFLQTTPPLVAELEQALQERNWVVLGARAHHLKSSLTGLQIHSLTDVVRRLENLTQQPAPDPIEAQQLVQQVRTVTDQVVEQLRREFPG